MRKKREKEVNSKPYPWNSAVPASPQPLLIFFSLSLQGRHLITWITGCLKCKTYWIPVPLWRSNWRPRPLCSLRPALSGLADLAEDSVLATWVASETSLRLPRSRLEGGETTRRTFRNETSLQMVWQKERERRDFHANRSWHPTYQQVV